MRSREANFSVRISETEKRQLDRIIKKCGLTKSAYIRMIITGYLPKETPPIEYHQVIKELNAIGNNLNQIAKIANTTGIIDKNFYVEQSHKLDNEILKINKLVVVPERIDFKKGVI